MPTDVLFLTKLKYVSNIIVDHGWRYASSGHPTSWSASVSKKVSNCSHMVSMALQQAGFLKSGQRFYSGDNGVIVYLGSNTKTDLLRYFSLITVKKTWKEWKKSAKPGDIVCWDFHTSVYAGTNSSGDIWYDAGRPSTNTGKVGGTYVNCHRAINMDGRKVFYVFRLKANYRNLDLYQGTFPTLPSRGYFKVGDTGEEVVKLQKFLTWALGLDPSMFVSDGILGGATKEIVQIFQGKVELTKDGLFGKDSLAAARKYHK